MTKRRRSCEEQQRTSIQGSEHRAHLQSLPWNAPWIPSAVTRRGDIKGGATRTSEGGRQRPHQFDHIHRSSIKTRSKARKQDATTTRRGWGSYQTNAIKKEYSVKLTVYYFAKLRPVKKGRNERRGETGRSGKNLEGQDMIELLFNQNWEEGTGTG